MTGAQPWMAGSSWPRELDQVPAIAVQVLEHGHGAVGRLLGLADEAHTLRAHRLIVAPEVVGLQEQEHAAARLIADECLLLGRRGAGKEDGRRSLASAGRRDEHP